MIFQNIIRKPRPLNPNEIDNTSVRKGIINTNPNDFSANNISTKGDITKDTIINIENIDSAILNYINNKIQPTVTQNGQSFKVPCIYGNQELWVSLQKYGYLREESGRIIIPIITLFRTSLSPIRLTSILNGNISNNYYVLQEQYTQNDQYNRFDILNGRKPVKKFLNVVVPIYIKMEYDLNMFTNYVDQMNILQEAFSYANDSFWGEDGKWKFKIKIDSFPTNTSVSEKNDRIIESKLKLECMGYIIPSNIQRDNAYKKNFYSNAIIKYDIKVNTQ